MAPLFSSSSPSRVTARQQFAAGAGGSREQGVAKDVAEDLAVDGFEAHKFHGAAHQTVTAHGTTAPLEGGATRMAPPPPRILLRGRRSAVQPGGS